MKKKNSLIEFYRFIFSMNVVKGHGYFPYRGPLFAPARISVEFFFVLSGFFLVKSIDKYRKYPFWKGLFLLLWDKIRTLGIPLLVGIIFGTAYRCVVGVDNWWEFSIWGYLWYVHDMLVTFIAYYVLRRLIKGEKAFLIVTFGIFIVSSVLHAIPELFSWGWFRAFSAMSLGVLISYLPKIQIKRKWLLLIPLLLACGFALKCLLADFSFIEEEILDLVAYPMIIYFTFHFDVHVKALNYLGSLSFGLYAFQNVTRFMGALGYENAMVSFIIILTLTVFTDLLTRILRSGKKKVPLLCS